jgi:RimJ/RimL family protein N-acetyltransferase
MSKTGPKEYKLTTGETVIIRTAVPDDAQALLEYVHVIFVEDLYNVTTLDEFKKTVEEERKWLKAHYDEPAHIALVAEVNGSLVGFLGFENGSRKRLAHQGTLHMSVQPQFRGKGIGTALLQSLIDWAEENPTIEKLCLVVFATNKPAIGLYKKLGFLEEGHRVRQVKIADGKYVDVILMYKFVKD